MAVTKEYTVIKQLDPLPKGSVVQLLVFAQQFVAEEHGWVITLHFESPLRTNGDFTTEGAWGVIAISNEPYQAVTLTVEEWLRNNQIQIDLEPRSFGNRHRMAFWVSAMPGYHGVQP